MNNVDKIKGYIAIAVILGVAAFWCAVGVYGYSFYPEVLVMNA